jgi:hypothetical protein
MYIKNPIAISQTDISGLLDSAVAAFDSSDPILQIIQIIDAAITIEPWRTEEYSLYYDSEGSLPASDSALEGMTVITAGDTTGISSLYLNIGTGWDKIQEFETIPVPSIPWIIQTYAGTNDGYVWGGQNINSSSPTTLDYFSFSNDTVISTSADLLTRGPSSGERWLDAGNLHSSVDAYSFGGTGRLLYTSPVLGTPWEPSTGLIIGGAKLPFVSKTLTALPAAASPTPTEGVRGWVGTSQKQDGVGYLSGGLGKYVGPTGVFNYVTKCTFSSDALTTGVGTISVSAGGGSGLSSVTNGYQISGTFDQAQGPTGPFCLDDIHKFPFAAGTPVTLLAEVYNNSMEGCSAGNNDVGYILGGQNAGTPSPFKTNSHVSFNYASDTKTSINSFSNPNYVVGGSAITSGDNFYYIGGTTNSNPAEIQFASPGDWNTATKKIPFASGTTLTSTFSRAFNDVGVSEHASSN